RGRSAAAGDFLFVASFLTRICLPGRDNSASFSSPCIHDYKDAAVEFAGGDDAGLPVIEALVDLFDHRATPNFAGRGEIEIPLLNVEGFLVRIPFEIRHLAPRIDWFMRFSSKVINRSPVDMRCIYNMHIQSQYQSRS